MIKNEHHKTVLIDISYRLVLRRNQRDYTGPVIQGFSGLVVKGVQWVFRVLKEREDIKGIRVREDYTALRVTKAKG